MTAEPALSPFAAAAPSLSALGFTPLPLIPPSATHHAGRGKCPAEYRAGNYQGMSGWQRYRDGGPSSFHIGMWNKWPDANIGVVCGTSAGRDLHLVVLDFDAKDHDALDTLLRAAPASPMRKRGMVSESRFYLAPKTLRTASYDGPDGRLLDVLTGFDTRQTVVPPSIHPETMRPYEWLGDGPVAAVDLPVLSQEDIEALEEALEQCGWERGVGKTARITRYPNDGFCDPGDEWSEVKAAALADLEAWVHDLPNLHGLRRARDGFEAVDITRSSSSGRETGDRKRNLSIQRVAGIKDFGSGWTGSAIDLVARLVDCSDSEALVWLQERLRLDGSNDDVIIDLQPHLAERAQEAESDLPEPLRGLGPYTPPAASVDFAGSAGLGGTRQSIETSFTTTHGVGREVPEHLTDVPGLVGSIASWITATARKPQPVLSLAAALGLVGTAAGRKFAGPTDSATHLFYLCTAGTGAGKNAPKKAAGALLAAANLRALQGPGSFMSASALIQHVAQHPASLCIMDEFGVFLGKLNGRNNSTHERAISGELRQFWSLCFEQYLPPKWASSASRQDVAPIISPALSIVGLSTPDEFYSALQGADVVSGFANRFLVMATDRNPEDVEPSASVFDVPPHLIQGLQNISGFGGPLSAATMHCAQADAPLVRVPWVGGIGSDAHQVFRELKTRLAERVEHEALTQRTAEMAVRLATIRAIGIAGERAEVSRDDMMWGAELASWSADRMIADVDAHMVESDHQARAKMVLRIIQNAPGQISRTVLCRKVNHRFDARTLDSVLAGLIEAGQVEGVDAILSSRNGAGRKPAAYRAVI